MVIFSLATFGLYLLGLLGLLFALLFNNEQDPRFEGDKLIYRS